MIKVCHHAPYVYRYMGLNGHYLTQDWKRTVFNLACIPFSEAHTGEHIYEKLVLEIVDWDIVMKVSFVM